MLKNNNSPKNKKIIHNNEKTKLIRKRRSKLSIGKQLLFDSTSNKENNINFNNINKLRNNNVKNDDNIIIYKNNTQPTCIKNKNKNNISSINEINSINEFGILNDFLDELDDNETIFRNKDDMSMTKELKNMFKRDGYFTYFHLSRTQENINNNIWNDFHKKREKLCDINL